MPSCSTIDPLVTPYVDGELAGDERQALEQHMRACPPCRARVATEQAVRELVGERKPALQSASAPPALRAKCSALCRDASPSRTPSKGAAWWPRLRPLALAAALVLVVGAAFVYPLTARSTRVLAAELAVDHMKCFMLNGMLGTHHSAASVESSLAASFGWDADLPDRPETAGLELVGERTCVYGEGRIAHVMYRHDGHPVSVFMLPGDARGEELVKVLGHTAAVWSAGGRTFVLLAREPAEEVQRMASFVHATLR
jgi:anti-sigma factor RsiW